MRVAIAIKLTDEDRLTLRKWARGRSTQARPVQQTQIVLATADGRVIQEIAKELGCARRLVGTWRNRIAAERTAAATLLHLGSNPLSVSQNHAIPTSLTRPGWHVPGVATE
jgi:hypothetical protein